MELSGATQLATTTSSRVRTEVGEIPADWSVVALGDCLKLLTDFEANGSFADVAANVRVVDHIDHAWYVRATDLENNSPLGEVRYVDKRSYDFLKKTTLFGGEVLITKRGEIGKVYLFRMRTKHATVAPNLYLLMLNERAIPEFVFYYFKNGPGNETLKTINASTTLGALYKNDVKNIKLALPPLPEQRAIATALSDVDGLLAGLDALIAKKKALKQGAMQQLLTGKQRLPGFKGEWVDTTLGQIISRFSTGLNPRQNFELNTGGAYYYVTIKNFESGRLHLDDECDRIDEAAFHRINERSDLRKDDILFSSIGRVGDAYLILETPKNWNINESVFVLRPDQKQVVPLMLFHLLTNKAIKDALNQGVTGSTFKSIKQADLKAIPCRLPISREEQTAIAEVLSDMDAELGALEARRAKTALLKQGMMQELLTGRTRLQY